MKFKYIAITAVIAVLTSANASGQTVPVTPAAGTVSEHECAFKGYSPDPYASAVILWESCETEISDIPFSRYTTTVTRRIKILKESGCHFATDSLFIDIGNGESLKSFSVDIFVLKDGAVARRSLEKNRIRKTRPDDWTQKISFSDYSVRAGSVIEISYQITSPLDNAALPGFIFQNDIPVNLATFSVRYPEVMKFSKLIRGAAKTGMTFDSASVTEGAFVRDTYRVTDIPAFKSELMSYCPDEHICSVSYLEGVMTWNQVARKFSDTPTVYRLKARSPFHKTARTIAETDIPSNAKLVRLLETVRSRVKWNGETDFFPKDFSSIDLQPYYGSSSDINALVGAAATEAGFNVSPVLVRLRTNGRIDRNCPYEGAFDTFILHITGDDGTDVYLNAADPCCNFNVLSDNMLTDSGFEICNDGSFKWVDLAEAASGIATYNIMGGVSPDGTITGLFNAKYLNESSFNFRDAFRGLEGTGRDLAITDILDATVTSIQTTGLDGFTPLSTVSMRFSKACEVGADGRIIVAPYLVCLFNDAAFRKESRTTPIDFGYKESINYVLRLGIPEGYVVESLPEPVELESALPSFTTVNVSEDDRTVKLNFQFSNQAMSSPETDYPEVRRYWTDVCRLMSGRIVFKRAE